jgi:hypothetical protein
LHSIVQWKVASLEPKSATVYDAGVIWYFEQLSIAQCYATLTYWNTSYEKEEYLADHKSLISSYQLMKFDDNYFRQMCVYVHPILTQS